MYEWLIDTFVERPERLIAAGDAAIHSSQVLLVAALVGNVATTAMSSLRVLGVKVTEGIKTLAELYPDLPTWWVPESPAAFLACAALLAAGLWTRHVGRRYQRLLGI